MSKPTIANDVVLVLNGLLKVIRSGAVIQRANAETILRNSNFKEVLENGPKTIRNALPSTDLQNTIDRASMVPVGLAQFAAVTPKYVLPQNLTRTTQEEPSSSSSPFETSLLGGEEILSIREEDLEGIYIQSLGVELLQQNEDGKRFEKEGGSFQKNRFAQEIPKTELTERLFEETSKRAKDHPKFLHSSVVGNPFGPSSSRGGGDGRDLPPPSGIEETLPTEPKRFTHPPPTSEFVCVPGSSRREPENKPNPKLLIKPLAKKKPTSQLGETSKQRRVPATRISRLVSYGSLAAGLGVGALAEVTKRSLGLAKQEGSLLESNPFLTESNATRIVDTLCRVRGAALKIGQILSLQDNSMINPQLQKVFERVRQSADFMPDWQMEKMLISELGPTWRTKLADFDQKPFAAASIGQVHLAKLQDGRPVAIKIQYPGVGQGINSDIDNLIGVLNVWNIIPEGIFIDNIITVAKRELAWEVDYVREAKCAKNFRKLMEPYPDYYVPDVIDEFTTQQVFTTELIDGIPVDQCEKLDQESRDRISYLMLDLFFRELFEFQFMQTDPNWANFLYNVETKQIGLLDFGASREYRNEFVDHYMQILKGAAKADRSCILDYSKRIGFLCGYESKMMENAHVDTVLLLGEAFRMEEYDFGSQDITLRIQKLVPVMVKERLVPPPEEIYSLHRKLSGIFLLCSRLKGRVKCRDIFDRVTSNYVLGRPESPPQI